MPQSNQEILFRNKFSIPILTSSQVGISQECTRNKIKDARPCGRWSSNVYQVPLLTRYVVRMTHEGIWCATSKNGPANTRPKKWPKPHSLSVFFWSAIWSYRLRPAQRTQRRLLDQLWASIACASVPFFFFLHSAAALESRSAPIFIQ
jgi:hypothetical protein